MDNKFLKARIKAEVLEDLYKTVERRMEDCKTHYGETDEMRQDYRYENGDKILLWEDDEQTIPKLVHVWADIPYTDEELENNPEVMTRISVYGDILATFEKML